MTYKQFAKRLDKVKAKQAALRDEMRTLLDEAEAHVHNADEALEDLERAADAVSRLL